MLCKFFVSFLRLKTVRLSTLHLSTNSFWYYYPNNLCQSDRSFYVEGTFVKGAVPCRTGLVWIFLSWQKLVTGWPNLCIYLLRISIFTASGMSYKMSVHLWFMGFHYCFLYKVIDAATARANCQWLYPFLARICMGVFVGCSSNWLLVSPICIGLINFNDLYKPASTR